MMTEPRKNVHPDAEEGDYILSLGELFQVIRRRLWVIALVVVLLTGAAVGYSLSQTPQYEASIKILVGHESGIIDSPNEAVGLQQLTQTMTEAVNSRRIAQAVVERLNMDTDLRQFFDRLTVEQIPDTQFIQVEYRDPDPERARQVADAVGEEFSEQIAGVDPGTNAITATVWEPAVAPDVPVSPTPLRNGLLAMALATILGVGLAFLLEYLYDTWRSPEEAEQISGVPTFGIIPQFDVGKAKKKGRVS